MKLFLTIFAFVFVSLASFAQASYERIKVSGDIELIKLSDKAYVHVSSHDFPSFGKVFSNGLLLVNERDAILFDSPATNAQTDTLYKWVVDNLNAKITKFVPNHWHQDCMGGIDTLKSKDVRTYASEKTIEIANKNKLTPPQYGFKKSMELMLPGNLDTECYYLGAAHTPDNIVVWVPSEKILFAGCMLKDLKASTLGDVAEANMKAWPKTIEKVLKKFPNAKIVIPGHGEIGGLEIVEHTLDLLAKE